MCAHLAVPACCQDVLGERPLDAQYGCDLFGALLRLQGGQAGPAAEVPHLDLAILGAWSGLRFIRHLWESEETDPAAEVSQLDLATLGTCQGLISQTTAFGGC